MRFRFQKRRHLTLDVGTGDILAERGDVLITGRISPRSPLAALATRWPHEEMETLFLKPTQHFHCEGGAWRLVFAIQWTARSGSYPGATHAFQQVVDYLSTAGLLAGEVRLGMTPFSWRLPLLTARLMGNCLQDLLLAVRDDPRDNISLHVSVRSLGPFPELTELLVRELPVRYGLLGFPLTPWIPDEGEFEAARV